MANQRSNKLMILPYVNSPSTQFVSRALEAIKFTNTVHLRGGDTVFKFSWGAV